MKEQVFAKIQVLAQRAKEAKEPVRKEEDSNHREHDKCSNTNSLDEHITSKEQAEEFKKLLRLV